MTAARKGAKPRAYRVRGSDIHGRGVFASRPIRKGAMIIEYRGQRIESDEADRRAEAASGDVYHTFLFQTRKDGLIIDAGVRGNAARWINHSCDPNCEALEDDDGRVFIHARRYIPRGTELGYDYRLTVGERLTRRLREAYACRCGAPRCRGTLLKVPRRKAGSPSKSPRKPPSKSLSKSARKSRVKSTRKSRGKSTRKSQVKSARKSQVKSPRK